MSLQLLFLLQTLHMNSSQNIQFFAQLGSYDAKSNLTVSY